MNTLFNNNKNDDKNIMIDYIHIIYLVASIIIL